MAFATGKRVAAPPHPVQVLQVPSDVSVGAQVCVIFLLVDLLHGETLTIQILPEIGHRLFHHAESVLHACSQKPVTV